VDVVRDEANSPVVWVVGYRHVVHRNPPAEAMKSRSTTATRWMTSDRLRLALAPALWRDQRSGGPRGHPSTVGASGHDRSTHVWAPWPHFIRIDEVTKPKRFADVVVDLDRQLNAGHIAPLDCHELRSVTPISIEVFQKSLQVRKLEIFLERPSALLAVPEPPSQAFTPCEYYRGARARRWPAAPSLPPLASCRA
jgi:hypothetical protein